MLTARTVWITGLLALVLGGAGVLWAHGLRLPGDHTGYEPAQPIAFSHALHAGELQVPCLYCHTEAERSRHAGIPAASTCMNCHRFVTARLDAVRTEEKAAQAEGREPRPVVAPELRKLYDALGLGEDLKPLPGAARTPVAWVRVHNLSDFVFFDHSRHVNGNVACETCHGPVQAMVRVRQEGNLSMGWCVNCHRDSNLKDQAAGRAPRASTDCSVCHY